ncbi:tetratricopeptide repeat protein [Phaeovulum sp. W22_SRMD_FR3]|uniref:tetratricopeptide repeat protein n=1 Tax=Phaeovulum sp. W22_SRMD_FR3 TaxID=3240274 RepID=UPI003F9512B1
MSDTDSFIDEVTDEVRRDRLFAFFRRYGWIGVAAVVLIVGGASYAEWKKARDAAGAQAFGDAVMAAVDSDAPGEKLREITVDGSGRQAMVEFLIAADALSGDDAVTAQKQLQTIAEDATLPDSLRQLAQLKLVILGGADMPAADRDAILATLAAPGAPYRLLAQEQQALALVRDGKKDEAVALARQILREADLTAGLRRRASELIVTLGADPKAE